MIYGDVCTGISAATVAWHPLGWHPAWFSEIEPFPCKLLNYRYPHVPNLGNMLHIRQNQIFRNATIDVLVGGTPCQSFSIAGLRGGLSDERGNLALEYCRILKEKQPKWFVWENVPGVFSSTTGGGYDFEKILEAFSECGYCCAWRVLDAQYFGIPQRRRRVFVVGYIGDWRPPATVLFESESVFRNFTTCGETGKEIAGTLTSRTRSRGGFGSEPEQIIPCWWDGGQTSQTLDRVLSKGQTMPEKNRFPAVLAYPYNQITGPKNRSNPKPGDPAPTLQKNDYAPLLIPQVRRLTPLECERLQGFTDYYTLIPGASDTVRYQAIGNSMAVPVMHWIGNRINIVDKFMKNFL